MGLTGSPPVRYRYQGRDPAEGLDCWGLVSVLFADVGIKLPDFVKILQDAEGSQEVYESGIVAYADLFVTVWPHETAMRPGDLLLFHQDQNHVGIVVDDDTTAHVHESNGGGVIQKRTEVLLRLPETVVKRYVGNGSGALE